jgi:hypothetical protein
MLRRHLSSGLLIEWALAGLILLSIVRTLWFLFTYMHLPAPFFYEPGDVHGDWFNTAFWAHNPDGAFDTWTTLYPPLSFVILRVLSISQCYPRVREFEPSPGYAARDCDWVGQISIYGFWILGVVLMYLALRKMDARRAIPRTICIGLGWPMLNGVERGNLVLIAFPFFVLAVMPILKSARARWIFAAMAINLKVYLIAPFLTQLFMRRWRWVESVLVATVVIYLGSYAVFGAGTLGEIVRNLTAWSAISITNPLDFWPATTYQGLSSLLESKEEVFPALLTLGSRPIEVLPPAIAVLLRTTQALLLLAMVATWLRPEVITRYRIYLLGMLFALITTEGGGYTPVFWIALVLTERWQGIGPRFAIVCCYILGCSYDIPISNLATLERYSYIFDRPVIVEMDLTVWPLLRPLVIQLIAIALALSTIGTVWRDVRHQGWADRWRFRHDAPILPWVRRPGEQAAGQPAE